MKSTIPDEKVRVNSIGLPLIKGLYNHINALIDRIAARDCAPFVCMYLYIYLYIRPTTNVIIISSKKEP